ncbi:MAG TPA: GntR family transcriptional regulator [Nocardioidaceae bacterium]|nr:GntR family transcriptional regulator [Nocardioidaceae bacterium]
MSAVTRGDGGRDSAALNLPLFQARQSLRHQVAHALRAALIAGEMRPGVLYSAPALAEKFGVSATPVREAMLDLANEGLVEAVRNKGFRVTELSNEELDDITDVRMLIEVPTIADIARHCDEDAAAAVEELRGLAREIEALAVEPDLIGYLEADRQFHLRLLALSGNQQLVEVVGRLRSRSRLYGLQGLADRGELQASAREHEQLVDLVLARDADAAGALMRRHITHVRGDWAGEPPQPGH